MCIANINTTQHHVRSCATDAMIANTEEYETNAIGIRIGTIDIWLLTIEYWLLTIDYWYSLYSVPMIGFLCFFFYWNRFPLHFRLLPRVFCNCLQLINTVSWYFHSDAQKNQENKAIYTTNSSPFPGLSPCSDHSKPHISTILETMAWTNLPTDRRMDERTHSLIKIRSWI